MPRKRFDQVRIVASPDGVLVRDVNGHTIEGVIAADCAVRPGQTPVIRLVMFNGTYDVAGTPAFLAMGQTRPGAPKAVKRIEFWDGEISEFPEPPDVAITPAAAPAPIPMNGAAQETKQ